MSTERFPLKDALGHPLGADCFVRVEAPNRLAPSHPVRFRGLVVRCDPVQDLIEVRPWTGHELLLGTRTARASNSEVCRKPPSLRHSLTDGAARRLAKR